MIVYFYKLTIFNRLLLTFASAWAVIFEEYKCYFTLLFKHVIIGWKIAPTLQKRPNNPNLYKTLFFHHITPGTTLK